MANLTKIVEHATFQNHQLYQQIAKITNNTIENAEKAFSKTGDFFLACKLLVVDE